MVPKTIFSEFLEIYLMNKDQHVFGFRKNMKLLNVYNR